MESQSIESLASRINLSTSLTQKATELYSNVSDELSTDPDVLMSGCILASKRASSKEKIRESDYKTLPGERFQLGRVQRQVIDACEIDPQMPTPAVELDYWVDRLQLDETIEKEAQSILREVVNAGMTENKPPDSVVAAVVYYAVSKEGNHEWTRRELSKKMKVTEVTITRQYKQILKERIN